MALIVLGQNKQSKSFQQFIKTLIVWIKKPTEEKYNV